MRPLPDERGVVQALAAERPDSLAACACRLAHDAPEERHGAHHHRRQTSRPFCRSVLLNTCFAVPVKQW